MMSKNLWLTAALCVLLCSQPLHAQTVNAYRMDIEAMFRLADANSASLAASQKAVTAAEAGTAAAKANRLPDVSTSLSGSFLGNGYVWDRHFENGSSVHIPHWGNNFALQASQAVYTGGALSAGIEQASLAEQMARLDLERNRQDVRFLLVGRYLNLYALHNQQQVIVQNIGQTRLVLEQMRARREQGTVLRNDVTRYELQLENLQLQLTNLLGQAQNANHELVTTLHLPVGTNILPDTTLTEQTLAVRNRQDWLATAATENIHLKQAATAVELQRQQVRLQKAELKPTIGIFAEEHLDGPITIEVPTLNNNFNYWLVGVGVKYNISSLYKSKKKVRQSQQLLAQKEEEALLAHEQTDIAVDAAYTDLTTALKALETQQKSVELARQNYEVTENRYRNGLALLTDMIDASNVKVDAELALVNARINVVYHYYKMKYTTHTL